MAIVLVTDFGADDLYVGQLELVFERLAPGIRVVHLLHEAPAFNVRASAHILAALSSRIGFGDVVMAVVDPGVGTPRGMTVLRADDRWFVGPDNGLLSVVSGRAARRSLWRIVRFPADASPSFHGRDVFAPVSAALACGVFPETELEPASGLAVDFGPDELPAVIYFDHYGNAFTGLRAAADDTRRLILAGRALARARTFAEAPAERPFWHRNSLGLAEIAWPEGSARAHLGLAIGDPVAWEG